MSRRKQSNPARHLDGENENRSLPMFPPDPSSPHALDGEGAGMTEDEVGAEVVSQPSVNEDYPEPVICVNCQQEFSSQWALMAHEKACRALTLTSDPYDPQADIAVSGPAPTPGGGELEGGEEEEEMEDPGVSQEELMSRVDREMMGEEGEEEMEEEGEGGGAPSDQEDYLGVPLSMTGAVPGRDPFPFLPPGVREPGKSEENKENNSGLSNQTEEGEDVDPGTNGEVVSGFNPAVAASLTGMFSGNNVTLEPMSATKAAVAQFPLSQSPLSQSQLTDDDSSTSPAEKALEELKRKDMMNQQIIRHMQMALLKQGMNVSEVMAGVFGMAPQGSGMPLPPAGLDMASAAMMMGTHSMADYLSSQAAKLQKEEAKALKEEGEAEESVKDLPKDLTKDIEQAVKQADREFGSDSVKLKTEFPSESKPPSSSPSAKPSSLSSASSMSSYLSSLTPSAPLSAVTSSSLSALSSMTNNSGLGGGPPGSSSIKPDIGRSSSGGSTQYSSSSLTALQRETDALKSAILPQLHMPMTPEAYRGYCQRGTILERAQYACDDPFFKHKCRFCHKVFGSDSALQIHVRSHTGERPFKCNICGNRFSTKGNLKVHFERHKAKYPHIKMNPNPVPESFDRIPVVPPPMNSATPIPSSLPLPSGLMPSEPPSPGGHRMMMPFPPGGGGPGGFFSPGPIGGFLPHPFARLPGPPPHHLPMMPSSARPMMSPSHPKSEPLPPASPSKPSFRDTPKSTGDASRPPSRAEADYSAPSSHGSSDKPSSRAPSPPPPTSSSVPPASSARSKPNTPVSSMGALSSPPIPPPLIPSHTSLPHHHPPPLSMPSPHPLSRSAPGPIFNHSMNTPTSFPLPSPLTANFPAMMRGGPHHHNPFLSAGPLGLPPGGEGGMFRNSILPTKTIDPSENLEQYMEIQKSETDKLQQLVENIPDKVREPNQCVICHRVLSCKSALQMHYRIHTGERPFKCKICSRKFTTKGNLKTHMGVHRSKSAMRLVHTCHVCSKVFTNYLVLQNHLRSQHGQATPTSHHHPHHLPPHHPHFTHVPMFHPLPGWPGQAALPPPHRMMAPPPPPPPQPFDLSRHHEPKELDLSNKRDPMFYGGEIDSKRLTPSSYHEDQEARGSADEEDERMDEEAKKEEEALGEEEMDAMVEEEREEEAYNLSRDGGSNGPASQGPQSAYSDNGDSDRPDSAASNAYSSYDLSQPLPPNGDVISTFLNPSQPPPRGVVNPSLAALEDHVNSLSASDSQSGFERFRTSLGFGSGNFFMDKSMSPGLMMPLHNGGRDRSPVSPRSSEAGSDGSREDSKFPSPDFSLGQLGFPMMGMDISRGMKSNTTCPTCFKTFPCRSALETHMRSHTKERPFQCDDCQRAFSTRGNLKQHQLTHRPEHKDFPLEPNPPPRDNGSSSNEGDNGPAVADKPQQESPRSEKPSSDSQANAGSGSSPSTSEPRVPASSSSSSSQESLPLPQSQNSLPSASGNNSNHDKTPTPSQSNNNNNNNKSFPDGNKEKKESSSSADPGSPKDGAMSIRKLKHVCDVCVKPFSSASALQIHTRTHTGDKPFKCEVCSKAFTTRGNLKVHMGTHMYHSTPSRRGRRMSIENPMFFSGNPYLAAAAAFPGVPPRPPPPHHPADPYFSFQSLINGMGPARPNEIPVIQNVNGALGHHLPMYPGFPPHPFSGLPGGEELSKHAADLSQARALGSDGGGVDREDRRREADREPSPPAKRFHERSPSPPPAPYPSHSSSSSSSSLPNGSIDNPAGTMTSTGELDLSMKSTTTPRSSPQEASAKPPPSQSPPRMSYPSSPAHMTTTPSPAAKAPTSGDRSVSPAMPLVKENGPDSVLCSPPPAKWVWNTVSCHRCGQNFPSRPALDQHIQTQHLNTDSHPGGQPITA